MPSQNIPQSANFGALITCLVLGVVFVAARTYARRKKEHKFTTEDYFCWAALAAHITFIALYLDVLDIIYVTVDVASGKVKPGPDFKSNGDLMMRHLFFIQLLFWVTLYAVKISLLFMFRRLTLGLPAYERMWLGVLIFTVVAFVGCVISEFTSCLPLKTYFDFGQCNSAKDARAQSISLYFSLAMDVLTDLLIMAIPMRLLWNLQISRVEKISVAVVMGVGVITMICAIVRASSLGALAGAGQIPISWLCLWASIEGLIALVVNCLPAFAIILRNKIVSIRSTNQSNSHTPYTPNTMPSQQRNKIRAESMLLSDVAPVDASRRSFSSRGGSDNTVPYDHIGEMKGTAM